MARKPVLKLLQGIKNDCVFVSSAGFREKAKPGATL